MASKILSVVLGSETAKLAEIALAGKKIQVFSAYDITLSEGLCDDGVIYNIEDLASELRYYIQSFNIKTKKIAFSISSKRIASKEVIIPFVKDKQIPDILKMNAQEYFPIANIESYSISHSILETIQNEGNKQLRLSVTATPSEILASYYELAKLLRMSVETIDYAGNAILQVLEMQTRDEVNAILQLGRDSTVINIMNGNVLIMQRTVSYALDAIINTVKDSIHLDDEDAQAFVEDNDIQRICASYPDVNEIMSLLTNGIGRIFEFYNSRNSERPITGVLFLGDGTLINGIGEVFEKSFGYPTEEILALKNVDVKNRALNDNVPTNFLANIGVLISSMNLTFVTEEEAAKKEKDDSKLPWGLVILSLIASVLLAGGSFGMYYMAKLERDALNMQLQKLEDMKIIEAERDAALSKSGAVKAVYDTTVGPNDSVLKLINDFETILPKGMTVDSLSISEGDVSLSMGGIGKNGVAKIIQNAKSLNYVRDVHVEYVSEVKENGEPYDSFTLTFSLLHPNDIVEDTPEEAEEAEETVDEIQDESMDVADEIVVENAGGEE